MARPRRRLTRRTNIPRSTSTPSLRNPESTDGDDSTYPSWHANMVLYPSTGLIAGGLRPRDALSTPTSPAVPSTSKSKKNQDLTLNKQSLQQAVQSTPLPPETPTKAAKVLGLHPHSAGGPTFPTHQHDGVTDTFNNDPFQSPYSRPQLLSAPDLSNPATPMTTKFREEDVDVDPPKSKKSWKKKAKHLLDSLTSPLSSPKKKSTFEYSLAPYPLSSAFEEETNYINRIGYGQPGYPIRDLPEPPEPIKPLVAPAPQVPPRRRKQKRTAKELERMMPITEASFDDMSAAYRDAEDNTELDVISEYGKDNLHNTVTPSQSRTEPYPVRHQSLYELEDDEISPADESLEYEYDLSTSRHGYANYATSATTASKASSQQSGFHRRSPLQKVEDRLLDVAETQLKAGEGEKTKEQDVGEHEDYPVHGSPASLSKAKPLPAACVHGPGHAVEDRFVDRAETAEEQQARIDKFLADKLALDQEVSKLRESHEKMKKDFKALTKKAAGEEENDDDDDEDLASIRSSIDLDEEPTVHVAMPALRVTPGMVRVVDIPPRKGAAQVKPKVVKRQAMTTEWVGSSDPTQQQPVSESIDQDVIRDRSHAPAPFPKK